MESQGQSFQHLVHLSQESDEFHTPLLHCLSRRVSRSLWTGMGQALF